MSNIPAADPAQLVAARVSAPGIRKPAPQLSELLMGGIQEQFEDAWYQVMGNLANPNMMEERVREINIRLVMKPTEGSPQHVPIICQVTTKLAPVRPIASAIYIEGINSQNPHGFEIGGVE
jgi:hypothetical protein